MTEADFFVVERHAGREIACRYRDRLPERLTRKLPRDDRGQTIEQPLMVYALRLDKLPNAAEWTELTTAQLHQRYRELRDLNALPAANLADPPRAAEKRGRKLGEWWEPPTWTWDSSQPFVQPEVGELRPAAGAFIGPQHVAVAMGEEEPGQGKYIWLRPAGVR